MTSNETPSAGHGMSVYSNASPDGSYGVTITVGPDVVFQLDREQAIAYAAACTTTAMHAEHQLAVLRLLIEGLKLDFPLAAQVVVRDLRTDRSSDDAATRPVKFEPTIGRRKGNPQVTSKYLPLVRVLINGNELGCLDPDDVRDHAEGVLDALMSARLDDRLFRYLTERIDLDAGKARAVVGALSGYLPADDGREPEEK